MQHGEKVFSLLIPATNLVTLVATKCCMARDMDVAGIRRYVEDERCVYLLVRTPAESRLVPPHL
eukprot:scaffold4647_cov393-Prasinococcus_capsulatus_cf.AAC.4